MTVSTAVATAVSMTISIAISMAISMAVSMGISMPGAIVFAAAAHAGFLYVPAEEPAAIAAGIDAEADGPHRRVAIEGSAVRPGSGHWEVHPGETLRRVLGRWGGRAEFEILFLTDRRYRLHEARTFSGSFDEATEALLAALSHLPHAPVGALRPDGRTLAVLHQARPHQASLHRTSPQRTRAPGEGQ